MKKSTLSHLIGKSQHYVNIISKSRLFVDIFAMSLLSTAGGKNNSHCQGQPHLYLRNAETVDVITQTFNFVTTSLRLR